MGIWNRLAKPNFWDNVDKRGADECWEWQAARKPSGYGFLRLNSKSAPSYAHRVAYESVNGPVPSGLYVCHRCDNPPCCNPAHLFLGTSQDNHDDMVSKGRSTIGTRNARSRLTDAKVAEILVAYARGDVTMKELGARYGVTWGTVRFIVSGITWKHVPGPRLSTAEREAIGSANLAAVLRERNTSRTVFKRPRIASNDAQKDVA